MKFLINNAIEALTPFREYYQGLVKLHVSLVGGVSIWGKKRVSKRRNFLWSKKITYEEAFQNLLKACLFFRGSLESFQVKSDWEATNVGKDQFLESGEGRGGFCENPVGLSMYERVIWKLVNIFVWTLEHAWLDVVKKLQKCTPSAYSKSTGEKWSNYIHCWWAARWDGDAGRFLEFAFFLDSDRPGKIMGVKNKMEVVVEVFVEVLL